MINEKEKMLKEYPPGTRIRLIRMDDVHAPKIGSLGTVIGVDDIGSILVSWDRGSSLSLICGINEFEVVNE